MSKEDIKRYIPVDVRRILRKEVNYGCPVLNCGSPFLSYHHFDPPWHQKNHHNPNGMIALCLHHHKAADNGAFTINQLKQMKKKPFLSQKSLLRGQIAWRRKHILFDVGSNYYIGANNIFIRGEERLIWLSRNQKGEIMINFDIRDKNGIVVFSMRNNDWIASTSLKDIESPPAMKYIKIKDKNSGVRLSIRFRDLKRDLYDDIKERILGFPSLGNMDEENLRKLFPENEMALCTVRGLLKHRFHIHFKDGITEMKNLVGPVKISGLFNFQKGAKVGNFELGNSLFIGEKPFLG
jgi:hypothetical protein